MRVGNQLLQDFGRVTASEKADGSLVTQADKWADFSEVCSEDFRPHYKPQWGN